MLDLSYQIGYIKYNMKGEAPRTAIPDASSAPYALLKRNKELVPDMVSVNHVIDQLSIEEIAKILVTHLTMEELDSLIAESKGVA